MSSLKNRFVLIFRLMTLMMMRVAAKLVHHQLNSSVGQFEAAERGSGGALDPRPMTAECVASEGGGGGAEDRVAVEIE